MNSATSLDRRAAVACASCGVEIRCNGESGNVPVPPAWNAAAWEALGHAPGCEYVETRGFLRARPGPPAEVIAEADPAPLAAAETPAIPVIAEAPPARVLPARTPRQKRLALELDPEPGLFH